MSGERYPNYTLTDMARIPADALPRYLAELPAILESVRQIETAREAIAAEIRSKAPWPLRLLPLSMFAGAVDIGLKRAEWVDDDKGTVTVRCATAENSPDFYSRTEPLPKVGAA